MKDRNLIQRALLRRSLRKQLRQATAINARQIQLALDDEAVFETLYEAAMLNAKQYGNSTGQFAVNNRDDGSPMVDNLLKLLQWFVDNGPMLLEIIRLISGMFGTINAAIEVCESETMYID